MERPKFESRSPEPDSKLEQSNVPAKPEKHTFNVIKAEADAAEKMSQEKPSQQGDTSSGKGLENTEKDWPTRRKQLVDSKMAAHEAISKKIAERDATATKHEETLSQLMQESRDLIAKIEKVKPWFAEIAKRAFNRSYDLIAPHHDNHIEYLKEVNNRQKLKDANNSIDNLHEESPPSKEEFAVFEVSIEEAAKVIEHHDRAKSKHYKRYIERQEDYIRDLRTFVIDYINGRLEQNPSSSTETAFPKEGDTKRLEQAESEQLSSTGDAPPPEKRAGLEDTVKETSAHHVLEGHGPDTEISKNPFLPQYEYLSASFVKKLKNLVDNSRFAHFPDGN